MKITITFPDEIGERICRRADRDERVSRAVAIALEPAPEAVGASAPSKWARLAERIDQQGFSLGDYSATFERERRELRRNLLLA